MIRSLISVKDLSEKEINHIFGMAGALKQRVKKNRNKHYIPGKVMGMIFEKSSTRTRISFEVGMYQLGGTALFLSSRDIQLGRGESIEDTARILSRYVDIIMARTFEHSKVVALSEYGTVPVINGLTDLLHPCQALADYYTVYERNKKIQGMKIVYLGDGNNVAHSLMYTGAKLGANVVISNPPEMSVKKDIYEEARSIALSSGGSVETEKDPHKACRDADVVYTDVWASMGQESDFEAKAKKLKPYQVNSRILGLAKKEALFMHCLPAHRGEEVSTDVIDGPNSVVLDQAENRLHVQKAVILFLMGVKKL